MGMLKNRIQKRSRITRDVVIREAAHEDVDHPEKETRPPFVVTILWPTQAVRSEYRRLIRTSGEQDETTGRVDVQIKSMDDAERYFAGEVIKGWTGLTVDTLLNWLRVAMSQTDIDAVTKIAGEAEAGAGEVGGRAVAVIAFDAKDAEELWLNAFESRFKVKINDAIAQMDRQDVLEGSDLKGK